MGQQGSKVDEDPWRPPQDMCDGEDRPQKMLNPKQTKTQDGTFVWEVDDKDLLRRFLFLGSDCTYKAADVVPERKHLKCLDRLISRKRGKEAVVELVKLSMTGCTPKQKYIIIALAVCARSNDAETKEMAYESLNTICRIPTHLFLFLHYCKQESGEGGKPKGWGRAHKRAVIKWYEDKCRKPLGVARLLTKYKARKMSIEDDKGETWSHKNAFCLAHPSGKANDVMKVMLRYVMKGFGEVQKLVREEMGSNDDILKMLSFLEATEKAKRCTDEDDLVQLIKRHGLEREHVPTQMMRSKKVCEALVMNMKTEAKLRNLCMISARGICTEDSAVESEIIKTLNDPEKLHAAKVHPFRILLALLAYEKGQGKDKIRSKNGKLAKPKLEWKVNRKVVDALNRAFDLSFTNVRPTGKRFLLAINVSDRMKVPCVGCHAITCDQAAAAMAMTTVRTEMKCKVLTFSDEVIRIRIGKRDTFSQIQQHMEEIGKTLKMDNTDCSLPMLWAKANKKKIDVFILYTDNVPTSGQMHASEALRKYREEMKVPNAKLIVVAMASNEYTIADPAESEYGMLNIVGFDTSATTIIAKFSQG